MGTEVWELCPQRSIGAEPSQTQSAAGKCIFQAVQEGGELLQRGQCSACSFSQILGKGCPMVVDIGGARQWRGLLQAVYTKPLGICCSFEVKFWFPQFGGTGPLWG